MRRALVGAVLLLILSSLTAQEIRVESVSGAALLVTGEGSSPLTENEVVAPEHRISLGENTEVTLRRGGRRVELFRRGLYEAQELFTFRPLGKISFEQIFENRIKGLTLGDKRSQGATAETLIAASGISEEEQIPEELVTGVRRLVNGAYGEARDAFAFYLDRPAEERGAAATHIARLLQAQCSYFLDDHAEAFETLRETTPAQGHPHFQLHLLLEAQLLVESHAFADALETLAEYLDEPAGENEELQTARLLTGVAYEGLGNLPVARTYYRRATSPDPTSAPAKAARRLLE